MKKIAGFLLPAFLLVLLSCNNNTATTTDSTAATNDTSAANSGSTANFKLGVQMWTFRMFTFAEALNKVDSAGIKYIEAFWGQKLGDGMQGSFGPDMNAETRNKLKQLLKAKGIQMISMGVVTPKDKGEWIKTFELAKDMGLRYITSEPIKTQWDLVDSLAGVYGINIAIHDHPAPNPYSHPDSVLAAVKNHQHIGACADIGHWARNGVDPVQALNRLEGHVIAVHLKDVVKFNDTQAADTTVSTGVIDIPAVLNTLKKQNFNGMLAIEHESNWYHSLPDIVMTRKYYEEQLQKLQ